MENNQPSDNLIHALVRKSDHACWECMRVFATAPKLLTHLLTEHWDVDMDKYVVVGVRYDRDEPPIAIGPFENWSEADKIVPRLTEQGWSTDIVSLSKPEPS